jgi:hypothetical protein
LYEKSTWDLKLRFNNIEKGAMVFLYLIKSFNFKITRKQFILKYSEIIDGIKTMNNFKLLVTCFKLYENNIQKSFGIEKGNLDENIKQFKPCYNMLIKRPIKYYNYIINEDLTTLLIMIFDCFVLLYNEYKLLFKDAKKNKTIMQDLTKISRYFFLYMNKLIQYPKDINNGHFVNIQSNFIIIKKKLLNYISFKMNSFKTWRMELKRFLVVNLLNEVDISHSIWKEKGKEVIHNLYSKKKYKSQQHVFLTTELRINKHDIYIKILYKRLKLLIETICNNNNLNEELDRMHCMIYLFFFLLWIEENASTKELKTFKLTNFYPNFKFDDYRSERNRKSPMIFEHGVNEYLCLYEMFEYVGNVFQVIGYCSQILETKGFFKNNTLKVFDFDPINPSNEKIDSSTTIINTIDNPNPKEYTIEGCENFVKFT